jgi:hypothetical protein
MKLGELLVILLFTGILIAGIVYQLGIGHLIR